MHQSIQTMLERYKPQTTDDQLRALREIIQEIALVGLWRSKFFDEAAFYGGTALRILYGLDRFSEDLDFSLLKPNNNFSLASYNKSIVDELNAFGFSVSVDCKPKNFASAIESAFIKANTTQALLEVGFEPFNNFHKNSNIKIKLEVDTNPPQGFSVEAKPLKEPIPIFIKAYLPSDLFAGKMHAVLCRLWKKRIKGRDWYDLIWFIRKGIPLNIQHLQERMHQSGFLEKNNNLDEKLFLELLEAKIEAIDVQNALMDIRPFIADQDILNDWSKDYFKHYIKEIIIS